MTTPSYIPTDSQITIYPWAAGTKGRPPMLGHEDIHSGDHVFLTEQRTLSSRKEALSCFTGIGDDIYSTVFCMHKVNEMRIAIERLQPCDPSKLRGTRKCKRIWTPCKVFQEALQTYQQQPSTSFKLMDKTEDTTPRYNNDISRRQFGSKDNDSLWARETVGIRKPKRVKDYAYHKEKMMMCKQAEQGVPLQAEQADWLEDTDEEIDEQELSTLPATWQRFRSLTLIIQLYWSAIEQVISDYRIKTIKDIDKMIEMDKQLKFLNEIVYTRNQSIQTIHMLAPKCATYNGRLTFANPRYLKKAQSEKPCLYEIPFDTFDPANRFAPDREETTTLDNESRSKLDKDTVEHLYQLERAK
ncbi:hypothetical protein Tco_1202679 [Tanacetum coccineum]